MAKPSRQRTALPAQDKRWAEFRRAYPKVARALDLFRISQEEYTRALRPLFAPKLMTSSSTCTPSTHTDTDADVD